MILATSHFCLAQDRISEEQEQALQKVAENLNSSDVRARNRAADTMIDTRTILVKGVLSALDVALKSDKSDIEKSNSSFSTLCDVVARWRIEQATGPLLEYIDFTLDPKSFREGGFMGNEVFYPAATALVAVRSPSLNSDLLKTIRLPFPARFPFTSNDNNLRIATWILQESNGNKMAQIIVAREIEEVGNTEDVGGDNLVKALALLKGTNGVELPLVEVGFTNKR